LTVPRLFLLMKKYNKYTIDDFVEDDAFCDWVLQPSPSSNTFWNDWLQKSPDKKVVVEQAREIINRLHQANRQTIPTALIDDAWQNIRKATIAKPVIANRRIGWYSWAAAAVALLIIGVMIFNAEKGVQVSEDIAASSPAKWIDYKNTTEFVKRIELADGSLVTLEPESSIKYPTSFDGKNRSVALDGEGFFDIQRDTTQPFYVYANATVIRVLGTSFFVKAKGINKEIEVIVKTGKVAVYKRKDLQAVKELKTKKIQPLLVTPNQKVVFDKVQQKMTRRLTSTPTLVKSLSALPKLRFQEASADEIFQAIADAFGVEIIYTANAVVSCPLTTTLTEQTLYEKLDIICEPLGLRYHEDDARIIISGQCR